MKLWHNNTELSLPISLCFLPSDSLYQWLCHFLHLTLPSLLFPSSTIWRLLVALCCLYHLLTKFRFVRVSEWQKSVCPQLFFLSPFFTLDRLIFFETVILAFNLVSLLPLHSFLFHLSVFLFFLFFVFVLCFVFFLSFLLDSCVLWPKKKNCFLFCCDIEFLLRRLSGLLQCTTRETRYVTKDFTSPQYSTLMRIKNFHQTFHYKHPHINSRTHIDTYCINKGAAVMVIVTWILIVHHNVCINSPFILCPPVRVIEIVLWCIRWNTTTVYSSDIFREPAGMTLILLNTCNSHKQTSTANKRMSFLCFSQFSIQS